MLDKLKDEIATKLHEGGDPATLIGLAMEFAAANAAQHIEKQVYSAIRLPKLIEIHNQVWAKYNARMVAAAAGLRREGIEPFAEKTDKPWYSPIDDFLRRHNHG